MSRRLSLAVAVAACVGCDRAPVRIAVETSAAHALPREQAGSPHGGPVELVAVTEAGDAALTADQVGTLRLWPTLDGRREAIPIASIEPTALALATSGDELIAAVVDHAQAVWVLRLARDGTIRGRVQLPGDVAARQVVAAGADLLVRRADETIERYDGAGVLHGKISAQPGARIGTIATRDAAAIATIVAGDDEEAHAVRWIDLGDELAWGAALALPSALEPEPLALSPGRRRIAGVAPASVQLPRAKFEPPGGLDNAFGPHPLVVFDVGATIRPYAMPSQLVERGAVIGFTDDDDVAIANRTTTQWWTAATHDPWAREASPSAPFGARELGAGAVADRVAVSGYAAGLELDGPQSTRYLGWGTLSLGNVVTVGDRVIVGPSDNKLVWLDDRLAETQAMSIADPLQPAPYQTLVVDERHVLLARMEGKGGASLALHDLDHPKADVALGSYSSLDHFGYEPSLHLLAISHDDRIDVLELDALHGKTIKRTALPHAGSLFDIKLLDPARSGGLVAVTTGYDDETRTVVRSYRQRATQPLRQVFVGSVDSVDDLGNVYEHTPDQPNKLIVRHADRPVRVIALGEAVEGTAASRDGTRIALRRTHEVALIASDGAVRWRRTVWAPSAIVFAAGDRRVVVRTPSGLVALDAETGAEVTRTCGWEFGLHTSPLPAQTYGFAPVCEDDGP